MSSLMEWQDEGIIIGGRRHGEASLILEVMTAAHGRHPGLVKGGRGKRLQPLLQPGNIVSVTWRARLEEHLGNFAVETTRMRGPELMGAPTTLHGLNLLLGHLRLLSEREPHAPLYEAARFLLAALDQATAPGLMVRFELALLSDSGFGLDLETCAATGVRDDLVYVSPKSARAVSRGAGAPYAGKLLPLPAFLREDMARDGLPSPADLKAGFQLTGFFLDRNLYAPRGLTLPASRDPYVALAIRRESEVGPAAGLEGEGSSGDEGTESAAAS